MAEIDNLFKCNPPRNRRIHLILLGEGGELDRLTIDTSSDRLSRDIMEALREWTLAPGDTIAIREEPST